MLTFLIRDMYEPVCLLHQTVEKQIWLLKDRASGERCIAKIQDTVVDNKVRTVLHEGKFMQMTQGYLGIPFLHWYSYFKHRAGKDDILDISLIIVEKLGRTLRELLELCGGTFSLKTTCLLGIEILKMLEMYHSKKLVLGKLTLEGLQMGCGVKNNVLYFNDLINSLAYLRRHDGKHVEDRRSKDRGLWKFNEFMSLRRMEGWDGSRKDDVEAVVLMLIYLLKGKLPWSDLMGGKRDVNKELAEKVEKETKERIGNRWHTEKEESSIERESTKEETMKIQITMKSKAISKEESQKMEEILRIRSNTTPKQLCLGLPSEFLDMMEEVLSYEYTQEPSYRYFIRKLRRIMVSERLSEDKVYDWIRKPEVVPKMLRIKREEFEVAEGSNRLFEYENEKEFLASYYYPYADAIDLQ